MLKGCFKLPDCITRFCLSTISSWFSGQAKSSQRAQLVLLNCWKSVLLFLTALIQKKTLPVLLWKSCQKTKQQKHPRFNDRSFSLQEFQKGGPFFQWIFFGLVVWGWIFCCKLLVEFFPLELMFFFFFLKKRFIKPPSGKTLKEPGSHNQGPKGFRVIPNGATFYCKMRKHWTWLATFLCLWILGVKGGVIFPMFHNVLIAFELLFDGDELRLLKELLAPLPSASWSKLEGAGGPERSLLFQREVGDATFFGKRNWHTIFWC